MSKKEVVQEPEEEIILTGFKIKKNGLALEYTTYEPMKKGGMVMNGEVNRKSPFPPTHEVLMQVDRLRYFFAKACGMWYDGFDEFIGTDYKIGPSEGKDYVEFTKANNTLEAIHIDQVRIGDSYKIGASVESMEGKYIHTITPSISEDDELFELLNGVMTDVLTVMKEFIRDSKYDIRKEAYDIVYRSIKNKEERLEVMTNMSERDILLSAVEILENKGAMLIMPPELDQEIVDIRNEREMQEKVSSVNNVQLGEDEMGSINMDDAKRFAESESDHISDVTGPKHPDKQSEQDWASGVDDDSENAEKEKLIAEEFM